MKSGKKLAATEFGEKFLAGEAAMDMDEIPPIAALILYALAEAETEAEMWGKEFTGLSEVEIMHYINDMHPVRKLEILCKLYDIPFNEVDKVDGNR